MENYSEIWRPNGITALGFFLLVSSLPLFALAVGGLPLIGLKDVSIFRLVFALGGIFLIVTGWGMLNMKKWSRLLALFVGALVFLASLTSLSAFGVVGMLIGAVLIWYVHFNGTVEKAFEDATSRKNKKRKKSAKATQK